VAFKLAEALGAVDEGLDLAALGLIADVVPHHGDVRWLVQRGLQALRSADRLGVQALLEVAEVDPAMLAEDDVGYALAPRLNALGRLADASVGVELFLTSDLARARAIAAEMEALNVRRQFLSRQVTAAAQSQLERDRARLSDPVFVLSHPDWPPGVLGIAAGRLAERYHRPVVLIAAPPDEVARGSARSVAGVDIHAALAEQSALFAGFGGHPMAAGFSLPAERIPDLQHGLVRAVLTQVGHIPPEPELPIAAYLRLPDLGLSLWAELSRLAPFGPGNPPLSLATRRLRVANERVIGRTGEHLRLDLHDEDGNVQQALWWHGVGLPLPPSVFDLAYVLRASQFRGERRIQLEWVDARWVEAPSVEVAASSPPVDIADYRTVTAPLSVLSALWDERTMQLWSEGMSPPGPPTRTRGALQPGLALVLWTAPPGPQVWQAALDQVKPAQVHLFALDPALDTDKAFLKRLAGLVKHALIAYGGRLTWEALGAAMAHRIDTVRVGLSWLASHGTVTVIADSEAEAVVVRGGQPNSEEEQAALVDLRDLLRETAAYRAFFRTAPPRQLFAGWQ